MSDPPAEPARCSRCGSAGPGVRVGPASGPAPLCPSCWFRSPPVVDDGADGDDFDTSDDQD